MELEIPSFSILLPLTLFMFMTILLLRKPSSSSKNLPPGPIKLPIIGNIHNLLGSLPHRSLHNLSKKFGPIMHLQLGECTTIIISSPDYAKQIMKTHDINFASRPSSVVSNILSYNNSDVAFAPYGEFWRQMRKICTLELLSAKRVQSFRPIRQQEMMNVLQNICANQGSEINLSELLLSYTYRVISRAAFGKITKEQEAFVPHVKDIMEISSGFDLSDLFPSIKVLHNIGGLKAKLEMLHKESDKIHESIINDHKLKRKGSQNKRSDEEGDDLVDVLLNLQENGSFDFSLTTDNIKATILDLFVAGSETSSTAGEWAMAELMKNPQVMEKAKAEVRQAFGDKGYVEEAELGKLEYLKMVIKETLRLHPPVPLALPRESQEDTEIDGYRIPAKAKVLVNVWSIGRDPSYWKDAEDFIPERFCDGAIDYRGANFEYIPFGAGRRICPGMTFGITNVELPLANLLYHFDWKLPHALDMSEGLGVAIRRKHHLSLIPSLCNPLPALP